MCVLPGLLKIPDTIIANVDSICKVFMSHRCYQVVVSEQTLTNLQRRLNVKTTLVTCKVCFTLAAMLKLPPSTVRVGTLFNVSLSIRHLTGILTNKQNLVYIANIASRIRRILINVYFKVFISYYCSFSGAVNRNGYLLQVCLAYLVKFNRTIDRVNTNQVKGIIRKTVRIFRMRVTKPMSKQKKRSRMSTFISQNSFSIIQGILHK